MHGTCIDLLEQSNLTTGAFLNVRALFRVLLLNGCIVSFRVLEVSVSDFEGEVANCHSFMCDTRVLALLEISARHLELLCYLMKSL